MPTAAFFDLDGCLVDSSSAIAAAMNQALGLLGLPEQPEADLYHLIGPPLLGSFEHLLPTVGGEVERAGEAVQAYRSVYPDLSRELTTAIPGITDALSALGDRHTLMVATSKPREFAVPILESLALDCFFTGVFGPALDALTEPKAVQLSAALVAAAAVPAQAVMVGDRRHDIEAAHALGTRSIGVTWGIGSRSELVEAGADLVVDRPDRLPQAVAG